jgi:hypothetical protein
MAFYLTRDVLVVCNRSLAGVFAFECAVESAGRKDKAAAALPPLLALLKFTRAGLCGMPALALQPVATVEV